MPSDFDQYGRKLVKHGPKGQPAQRRKILLETLEFFADQKIRDLVVQTAQDNVSRWRLVNGAVEPPGPNFTDKVTVIDGDWGVVAHDLTQTHGVIFAVLNMANAWVPGGGYVEGMPAQEENMFRRTDCHFSITANEFSRDTNRYLPKMTDLINARHGRVSLDTKRVRVCVRGPEKVNQDELGYLWLDEEEVFPFYELKAAAVDLRRNQQFDEKELARRICAQLDTLIEHKLRHVVLSAFGCGAFRNPAVAVARQYRIAIEERLEHFDCITFAIHHPGYGPNNYLPFKKILSGDTLLESCEVTQEFSPPVEEEPDLVCVDGEEKDALDHLNVPSDNNSDNNGNNSGSGGSSSSSNNSSSVDSGRSGKRSSNDHTNGRNSSAWQAVRASILGFAMAKKTLKPVRANSSNAIETNATTATTTTTGATTVAVGGEYQWYWQTKQGWTAYDEQSNALLERSISQKIVKLSPQYYVDVTQMKQFRSDDKNKWRRVKREGKV